MMAEAVRDDRDVPAPGTEARKSLALVLAMYESARTGRAVDMTGSPWQAGRAPS